MKRKSNSVLFSWITSYFLFILLFIVSSVVMFLTAKNYISKQVEKTNEAFMNTIQISVDNTINEVESLTTRLYLNDAIHDSFKGNIGENADEYLNIKKVQETLESNRALHPFIKYIGIYYANHNRIIADFGASKAENLYEEFLIGEEVLQEFHEWKSIVDEHQTRRLYPSGNELIYVQTINDIEVAGNVVIMVVLKRNDLISEFVDTQKDTTNTYIMLNRQGEIVFTTNNGILRETIKNGDVDLSKKFQHTSGMMVSTLTSKNSHLTHIYGIRSDEYYKEINRMMQIDTFIILLLLVSGVLLALYYSRKHYKPIKTILKTISGEKGYRKDEDEMQKINSSVKSIILTREKYVNKYKNVIFQSRLLSILRDGKGAQTIEQLIDSFDEKFEFKAYMATTVSIIDYSEWYGGMDTATDEEEALLNCAISNVIEELLGSEVGLISVPCKPGLVLYILGTNQADEEGKEHIKTALIKAQNISKNDVGIYYTTLGSEMFSDINDLKVAYRTLQEFEMVDKTRKDDNVFCDEIEWNQDTFRISELHEIQVENYIKSNNADDALRVIFGILDKLSAPHTNYTDNFNYVKFTLLGLFVRLSTNDNIDRIQEAFFNIDSGQGESATERLKKAVSSVVEYLCEFYANKALLEESDKIVDEVIEYINQNYFNPEVNVNQLGRVFGISPNYLSKRFKLQTGEMLKDYLADVRIKQAKKELRTTNNKIADISRHVGFVELTSFNRAFKRYVGISPSQYREINDTY